MSDLFEEKTPEATTPENNTFTIGDKQYTQDELNDLVARGEQARDVETRFNTKLDRVVPDYTRASQEAAELRKKVAEYESRDQASRAETGQLTRDEILAKIQEEAAGVGLLTARNAPEAIRAEIESYDLIRETESLAGDLEEMGISADPQVIIRYMDAANVDSPQDAIDQLYGNQIKSWQDQQLEESKPEDWATNNVGGAGGYRLPEGTKVDRNTSDTDLAKIFSEAIGGSSD